jgi:flavodoxin
VYDSVFGNTEKIAKAIGEGLGSPDEVSTVQVNDVDIDMLKDLSILVVGSPTRAFKCTPAISDFLKRIPANALSGITTAAFDTRISVEESDSKFLTFMVKLFGYAAEPMAEKLKKKGGTAKDASAGFFVGGTEGPLRDGELERAAAWAGRLLTNR